MAAVDPSIPDSDLAAAIDQLVDKHRASCLWFLREDFYPTTLEERLQVLEYISRYGDRAAFVRASKLRGRLPTS